MTKPAPMSGRGQNRLNPFKSTGTILAERQGFEPWRRFPAYTRSRRAPSTTRPPLRGVDHIACSCPNSMPQCHSGIRRRRSCYGQQSLRAQAHSRFGPKGRVEDIAEPVAHKADRQRQKEYRRAGKQRQPPSGEEPVSSLAHDLPQTGQRRLNAET